jgi:CoA:oxalate CoA-transferase
MSAIGDVSTGVHAYAAIMTALLYRERTGEGQHIDISLLDSYFHYQDMAIEAVTSSHGEMRVKRIGGHVAALSPCGMFKVGTGYIWIMAFQDNHWANLCNLIGRADLINDPHTNCNTARVENREVVNAAIDVWLRTSPDRDSAAVALREARIPHAPVLSPEEAMAHPHLQHRGTVRTIHDRLLGDFSVPGFPFRFSGFPEQPELDAPFLGEHNRAILTKYLDYPEERIAELERAGILVSASH